MSLDVYLYEIADPTPPEHCLQCIAKGSDIDDHVRDDDHWHERCVFDQNVTHNLGRMAAAAGIYEACWRPEELMDLEKAETIRRLERQYFDDQRAETRHFYDEAQELRATLPTPHARDIAPLLRQGLEAMKAAPAQFRRYEPKPDPHTGKPWGTYDGFVPWLERYLAACEEHPDAIVRVSR